MRVHTSEIPSPGSPQLPVPAQNRAAAVAAAEEEEGKDKKVESRSTEYFPAQYFQTEARYPLASSAPDPIFILSLWFSVVPRSPPSLSPPPVENPKV